MKKLIVTTAIILGLATTALADPNGGGLFQRGISPEREGLYSARETPSSPMLPNHGLPDNQDADQLPLGSGIAVLLGLGGAYLVAKKRKEA